jgi:hypothetical protein
VQSLQDLTALEAEELQGIKLPGMCDVSPTEQRHRLLEQLFEQKLTLSDESFEVWEGSLRELK